MDLKQIWIWMKPLLKPVLNIQNVFTYTYIHLWSCPWMDSLHLNKTEYSVHVYHNVFIQVKAKLSPPLLSLRNIFCCIIWSGWLPFYNKGLCRAQYDTTEACRQVDTNLLKAIGTQYCAWPTVSCLTPLILETILTSNSNLIVQSSISQKI